MINGLFFCCKSIFFCTFASQKKKKPMSDGNFNRALLPSTPYASGVKAGKAQERVRVEKVFRAWLQMEMPQLTTEEVEAKVSAFKQLL